MVPLVLSVLAALLQPSLQYWHDCPTKELEEKLKPNTLKDVTELVGSFRELWVSHSVASVNEGAAITVVGSDKAEHAFITTIDQNMKEDISTKLAIHYNKDGSFTLKKAIFLFVAKFYVWFKTEDVVGYFLCGNKKLVGFEEEVAIAVRTSKPYKQPKDTQKICSDVEAAKAKLNELGLDHLLPLDKKLTICDGVSNEEKKLDAKPDVKDNHDNEESDTEQENKKDETVSPPIIAEQESKREDKIDTPNVEDQDVEKGKREPGTTESELAHDTMKEERKVEATEEKIDTPNVEEQEVEKDKAIPGSTESEPAHDTMTEERKDEATEESSGSEHQQAQPDDERKDEENINGSETGKKGEEQNG